MHYCLESGGVGFASEKGSSVNGAGSGSGAVPARSSGNYFAALGCWDGEEGDGEGVASANGETSTQHNQDAGDSDSSKE